MNSDQFQSSNRLRKAGAGLSTGHAVILALLVLLMALGGLVLLGSHQTASRQKKLPVSFVGWYEDKSGYDRAMADQRETQKPVLVYIYAPWCPHCKTFSAKVLADSKMKAFLQDYPHVRVAPDHGEAEKKIMDDYGAPGYPAFYVVMPSQQHSQIETFVMKPKPRLKTPLEFMKSILQATGGA